MGFCTEDQCEEFFRSVPELERMLVRSGIILIKYWFSITDEEEKNCFLMRIHDPLKQWKLSPMDGQSRARWEQYTKAKEEEARSHPHSRGAVVGCRGCRQEAGATELHIPPADANSIQRDSPRARCAAGARMRSLLLSRPAAARNVRSHDLLKSEASKPYFRRLRMSDTGSLVRF